MSNKLYAVSEDALYQHREQASRTVPLLCGLSGHAEAVSHGLPGLTVAAKCTGQPFARIVAGGVRMVNHEVARQQVSSALVVVGEVGHEVEQPTQLCDMGGVRVCVRHVSRVVDGGPQCQEVLTLVDAALRQHFGEVC